MLLSCVLVVLLLAPFLFVRAFLHERGVVCRVAVAGEPPSASSEREWVSLAAYCVF